MRTTLAGFGLPPDSYLPRDGSGLSRYDYVSADALTTLLGAMASHPTHADRFRSTLPVAGISGLLANRMKGTPAEGRVVAKTGALFNVRSLAGYLTTLSGEPMAFAILVNNFRVSNREIDAITDKALVRLRRVRAVGRRRGWTTGSAIDRCVGPVTEVNSAGLVDQHRTDHVLWIGRPRKQLAAGDEEITAGGSCFPCASGRAR